MPSFQDSRTFQQRREESEAILAKFPERVPVILEPAADCDLPPLKKCKYLVPSDLSMGSFIYTVRKRMQLPEITAMFIFVMSGGGKCTIAPGSGLLGEMYMQNKQDDGFLYLLYHSENVFG